LTVVEAERPPNSTFLFYLLTQAWSNPNRIVAKLSTILAQERKKERIKKTTAEKDTHQQLQPEPEQPVIRRRRSKQPAVGQKKTRAVPSSCSSRKKKTPTTQQLQRPVNPVRLGYEQQQEFWPCVNSGRSYSNPKRTFGGTSTTDCSFRTPWLLVAKNGIESVVCNGWIMATTTTAAANIANDDDHNSNDHNL
jgi:hypothetical protein